MMRRIAPILPILLLACGGGGGGTSLAGGGIGGTGISSGPITAIGSFFVTGTEWSVDPATGQVLLDGEPFSENDLALGMVVTVEGTRAADGTGTATRVTRRSSTFSDSRSPRIATPSTRAPHSMASSRSLGVPWPPWSR
jgi:hypothetical protein